MRTKSITVTDEQLDQLITSVAVSLQHAKNARDAAIGNSRKVLDVHITALETLLEELKAAK